MIKIKSYVVIAFCYRKANVSDLVSYTFATGTKACVTAADLIDSDENLHFFTLSSCKNLYCVSVQMHCRNLAAFQCINTQPFAFFLTDSKLAPTGLRSDLVTADAD